MCVGCKGRAWPILHSKAGKVHCAAPQCRNGEDQSYLPVCFRCNEATWDGQWRGVNQLAAGKGFFCRKCWIRESPPEDQGKWARWFSTRAKLYPKAFSASPKDWELQVFGSSL